MGTYLPDGGGGAAPSSSDNEKDSGATLGAASEGEGGIGLIDERERGLARALKQRHIQMIALAGAIVSIQVCLFLSFYVSCLIESLLLCLLGTEEFDGWLVSFGLSRALERRTFFLLTSLSLRLQMDEEGGKLIVDTT